MEILTIRQPYAQLVIAGVKAVENRSWRTRHRGPLGIHAAARPNAEAMRQHGHLLDADPPLGVLLGSVTLVDCVQDSDSEWAQQGAWHWVLSDPRPLETPIPMAGRLGIWTLTSPSEFPAVSLRDPATPQWPIGPPR